MGSPISSEQGSDTSYSDYQFVAEYYDYVVPYHEREDIEFYRQEALRSGGPILELGCGTGRVLLPIAREGIQITGVDLSSHMLAVCRNRLEQEAEDVRERVNLIQADMTDVKVNARFDLVTSPFRAFQHLLTVEAQIAALENAYEHLLPGGRLVLDVFNPSLRALITDNIGEEFGAEPEFFLPDGRRVIRTHKINERDLAHQVSSIELIYNVTHPDGLKERFVHAFKMRHLFRYEMEHLLSRSGFEIKAVFSDFDRKPFGAIYPGELIFIAGKPG